jgi:sulfur-oxidizing protein SoxY
MGRRALLMALALLAPLLRSVRACAEAASGAFSAASLLEAMQALFGERRPQPSDAIVLDVEPKIENGAVVPLQIDAVLDHVTVIDIFAELNPNPLIARFHISPRCRPTVATRIKVAAPSNVVIVVESGEQLHSTSRFVEVVEGGCG